MPAIENITRNETPQLAFVQRVALIHLLTEHDPDGQTCDPAHLAHALDDIPTGLLHAALDELERHCLIDRTCERFTASPAARHVDRLELIAI